MRLANKIGLVTAAASGMGRAGALRFAREGAAVGVVDIDDKGVKSVIAEINAAGGQAIGLTGDLRDDKFSKDIVTRTVQAFGGLDFAWCHAGHPGPAEVEHVDMELFDIAVELNLRTLLITTAAAIPEMRKRGKGSLVYTASTSGLRGSMHSPVYSMMKFGVVGFVRSLAGRYAAENIRANAICPGGVDTPMLRTFVKRPDDTRKPADLDVEKVIAERGTGAPMGRAGQPHEIAAMAAFLISDDASFVTGAAIPVDGGTIA
jgi:NAD(P)-dependent dehydrogenase (short-subunit alcohol dehydrogenase family)